MASQMMVYIVWNVKHHEMYSFIKNLSLSETELKQLKCMTKISMFPFVLHIFNFIMAVSVELHQHFKESNTTSPVLWTIVGQVMLKWGELFSWFYMTIASLKFIFEAYHFKEMQGYKEMLNSFRETPAGLRYQLMHPMRMTFNLKSIFKVKKSIMKLYSIIPVIWFLHLIIISVRHGFLYKINMMSVTMSVFNVLVPTYAMISLLLVEGCHREKTNRTLRLLARKASLMTDSLSWVPVLKEIDRLREFKFHGYDMFVVGKEVITPFVSSVISIIVLIIQTLDQTVSEIFGKLNTTTPSPLNMTENNLNMTEDVLDV